VNASALTHARDVRGCVAWLRRFTRTTPGVIVLTAVTVAATCIVAGIVCAAELDQRIAHRNAVLDRSEPFTYAAQNLYADLSAADAAAASAFLSGGIQTPSMRARYQQALAGAASALADATAGATDIDTRTAVAEISEQLGAYTGLVEAARANNVQGFPLGSAYLREASLLMRTKLLPGSENIHGADLGAVDEDQRGVASTPTVGLVLLGLALGAIGIASAIMLACTNRRFNIGLVVAAAVVSVVVVWIVVATRFAVGDIEHGRVEGTARFGQLARARILASKARTDETLELIAHGDVTGGDKDFNGHIAELVTALGAGPPTAAEGLRKWTESHRKQVAVYLGGDYPAAVAQAIGPDPDASAAQYAVVESSLRSEIEHTRAALRDRVWAAGVALSWSPTGSVVLMVVAAAAAVIGLWPRLEEFL
jgi:hypothetical protein